MVTYGQRREARVELPPEHGLDLVRGELDKRILTERRDQVAANDPFVAVQGVRANFPFRSFEPLLEELGHGLALLLGFAVAGGRAARLREALLDLPVVPADEGVPSSSAALRAQR